MSSGISKNRGFCQIFSGTSKIRGFCQIFSEISKTRDFCQIFLEYQSHGLFSNLLTGHLKIMAFSYLKPPEKPRDSSPSDRNPQVLKSINCWYTWKTSITISKQRALKKNSTAFLLDERTLHHSVSAPSCPCSSVLYLSSLNLVKT
jgi:hypothetical protein